MEPIRFERNGLIAKLMIPALVVGVIGLAILYFWNPTDVPFIPRCPFLVLTGLKCPGCGTLRGIHCLLHFRLLDAWRFNPLMILSIPVLGLLICSRKMRHNRILSTSILIATLLWWVGRNVFL